MREQRIRAIYSCDYDILLAWGEPTTEEVAVYNLVHRV